MTTLATPTTFREDFLGGGPDGSDGSSFRDVRTIPAPLGSSSSPSDCGIVVFDSLIDAIRGGASVDVIQSLISTYEGADGADLSLPLAEAVRCSSPLEVIQLLINAFPDNVREGLWAASKQPSMDLSTLRLLLAADPEGVRAKDSESSLPIHYAAEKTDSVEVIQLWTDAFPKGLACADSDGRLPIHRAAAYPNSVDIVCALVAAYPSGVTTKTDIGSLPLHVAAHFSSLDVVQALLSAFPDGACQKDRDGRLPLHRFAMRTAQTGDIFRLLLSAHTEAIKVKDVYSALPMSYATQCCKCVDSIQFWMDAYPEGVSSFDIHLALPIHYAVGNIDNVEVIRALIEKYPAGLSCKDKNDELPLHRAARYTNSVEVMRILIDAYPQGVSLCDIIGATPIHYAAGMNSEVGVVRALVENFPDSLICKDRNGEVPIHWAVQNSNSVEVVRSLIAACPSALLVRNHFGYHPLLLSAIRRGSAEIFGEMLTAAASLGKMLLDTTNTSVLRRSYTLIDLESMCMLLARPHGAVVSGNRAAVRFDATMLDALIAAYPDGAKIVGTDGRLLMHQVMLYNQPSLDIDFLRLLHTAHPEGVSLRDANHSLPIHYAASSCTSLDIIRALVDMYPVGLSCKNKDGDLPLHLAARSSKSVDVVRFLIGVSPEALSIPNNFQHLPLYLSAMRDKHDDCIAVFEEVLTANPHAAVAMDKRRCALLHYNEVGRVKFLKILAVNAHAARGLTWDGQLPLHCSVNNLQDVRTLIAVYPEGLAHKSNIGQLPLHCAARFSTSAEVICAMVDSCPDGLKSTDNQGNLPMHCAAGESNSVEVLQTLIAAFPGSLLICNTVGNLPLHIVLKRHDCMALLDVILNACPKAVGVADRKHSTLFHHHNLIGSEKFMKLLKAYPQGACFSDGHGLIPLNTYYLALGEQKFDDMKALLHLLHRNPELAVRQPKVPKTCALKVLWHAYCRAFAPTRSNMSNLHIHICGEPFAGKSVVFHWIASILGQNRSAASRMSDMLPFSSIHFAITLNDRRATRGMVTATVPYTTDAGRCWHCIIHDYGSQAQYRLTHSAHLSCPSSVYVVVLPLFDMSAYAAALEVVAEASTKGSAPSPATGRWYTVGELEAQLKDWLRMIYSIISVPDVDATDDDEVASLASGTVALPVLVVVNKFASIACPNSNPVSLADIQSIVAKVAESFVNGGDLLKKEFHFLEPVMVDACYKADVYKLEAPLIKASEKLAASQREYSKYHCVDFVLKNLPSWRSLLMSERVVLETLRDTFRKHNYQQFATMTSSNEHVAEYLATEQPITRLAEFCLQVMIDMNDLMVLNAGKQEVGTAGVRIIFTNPNWLTNKIVGEVLFKTSEQSAQGVHPDRPPLVYTHEQLNAMVPDLPDGISVATVLECVGLAVPVTISSNNEIVVVSKSDRRTSNLYILGLVDSLMPLAVKQACSQAAACGIVSVSDVLENQLSISGVPSVLLRSISRLFCLRDSRNSFVPGFFMKLFTFVHNRMSTVSGDDDGTEPLLCPERCWYWKDGMAMKSIVRWKTEQGMDMEGFSETLMYPFNQDGKEGFVVTMNLWVKDCVVTALADWKALVHPVDIIYSGLNSIREFIFCKDCWDISLDEYVLPNISAPLVLADAELRWFNTAKTRAVIRKALLGHVFGYNALIAMELDCEIVLSKATTEELVCCNDWNGIQLDFIKLLRTKMGFEFPQEDLKLWILRYYRSKSMVLNVRECERIVNLVLSTDLATGDRVGDGAVPGGSDSNKVDPDSICCDFAPPVDDGCAGTQALAEVVIDAAMGEDDGVRGGMEFDSAYMAFPADASEAMLDDDTTAKCNVDVVDDVYEDAGDAADVPRVDVFASELDGLRVARLEEVDEIVDSDSSGDEHVSPTHCLEDMMSMPVTPHEADPQPADSSVSVNRILDALSAVQNELGLIRQEQDASRDRNVEGLRRIHNFPLLAVLSRYQGGMKKFARSKLRISSFKVHFHCNVCGCRSSTAGDGYKLCLGTKGTQRILQVFKLSLNLFQLMLQVSGVPNQISMLAEIAISSLDILTEELQNDFMKVVQQQDVESLRQTFTDACTGKASSQSSPTSTVSREMVVTQDLIDSVEGLFAHFKDPSAKNSGLEKAIKDNGEAAWVCRAAEGKSVCYKEFMDKGQDCIGVLLKYE